MAKQRIGRDEVVSSAIELVDAEGLDELALSKVAGDLGVQSSALYNHVDGLGGLRQAIRSQASENLADVLRDAAVGRSGDDAVAALAVAYRQFATDHPGQYGSTLFPAATRLDVATGSEASIIEVLARILDAYGMTGDDAIHHARIVRSAIHGFVTLEASDAFTNPQEVAATFAALIDFVRDGLNANGS